jgi:DNA oxidative demethylase
MAAPAKPVTVRRRSRYIPEPPRGLRYVPEFLDADEEQRLLTEIERLRFEPVRMHGIEARRRVVHFGTRYQFDSRDVTPTLPIPDFLQPLYERAAAAAGFPRAAVPQALVTRYPPGAGIGWHRDAPPFGAVIVGISLGTACEMRFRMATAAGYDYDVYKQELEPRSLYLFSGAARFHWQHMIPAVQVLRYSVTFRTVGTHDAE